MKLLMVALFAALTFTLTSCGDDDDDDDSSDIVGTWQFTISETKNGQSWKETSTFVFNKDNTCSFTQDIKVNGQTIQDDYLTGTYKVDGDLSKGAGLTCNMVRDDGAVKTMEAKVKIKGNKAYITDSEGETVWNRL